MNHVYSILKNYSELNDWREAISKVIPERKVAFEEVVEEEEEEEEEEEGKKEE